MPTPFGTDRLEPGPPGREGTLRLRCAVSKDWRPRVPGSIGRAEHPGTAVRWEGEVFEVIAVEVLPAGDIRYALAPWRAEVAIRVLEPYDEPSESARAEERRRRATGVQKRRLALLLSPILGHLPGSVQETMEHEFGAPANAMTTISALPLFTVGIVGVLAGFARLAGGSLAPLPEPSLPLSIYLVLESSLRIGLVVTQSRPAGSLAGVLAWELWKIVRTYNRRGGSR